MKQIKMFLWVLVVAAAVAGYIAGMSLLKRNLEADLSGFFGQPVTIRSVQGTFPPGFTVKGIAVSAGGAGESKTALTVAQASVQFSFLSVFSGQPGCDLDLVQPVVRGGRDPQGRVFFPLTPDLGEKGVLPFVRVRIRDGELFFADWKVTPEVLWTFRQTALSVKRGGPFGVYLYSLLTAIISPDGKPIGKLAANGSFSVGGKKTDGKIAADHAALEYLAPYIQPILGTAPSRGACSITSQVMLQNGEVKADTKLSATGLVFPTEQPTALGLSGNQLVELLKDKDGAVRLSFILAGRLDEGIDWFGAISMTIQNAIRRGMTGSIQNALGTSVQEPVGEHVQKGIESLGR